MELIMLVMIVFELIIMGVAAVVQGIFSLLGWLLQLPIMMCMGFNDLSGKTKSTILALLMFGAIVIAAVLSKL